MFCITFKSQVFLSLQMLLTPALLCLYMWLTSLHFVLYFCITTQHTNMYRIADHGSCSLKQEKIKSLSWQNTIILCYLSPREEHLFYVCVCVCACMWPIKVHYTIHQGLQLHSLLNSLIGLDLSGSRHGICWLDTLLLESPAQEKTTLAQSRPWWEGYPEDQECEESSLSVHTCPFFIC